MSKETNVKVSKFLSWLLLFVILVSLGLTSYKTYVGFKIQDDMYSRIWDTVTPKTEDEDGNSIEALNVIYKMYIYDYIDSVLINIPVGSNDLYYDIVDHDSYHDKGYIKYLKNEDGSLSFDGVILHIGYDKFLDEGHYVKHYSADTELAIDFLHKTFEYIFIGNLKSDWTAYCHHSTIDFYALSKVKYDYLITWQQQTNDAYLTGGLFGKMYEDIVKDALTNNVTAKSYTKQFFHDTSNLQYIKCFVNNECINANIYCDYTRTLFNHNFPSTINLSWYSSEILGGNV